MARVFEEYVSQNSITDDEFPHAKFGRQLYSVTTMLLKWAFFFALPFYAITKISSKLLSPPVIDEIKEAEVYVPTAEKIEEPQSDGDVDLTAKFDELTQHLTNLVPTSDDVKSLFATILNAVSGVFWFLFIVLLVVSLVLAIIYMFNTVKRWRCFERDVLANDFRAKSLKKKLIRAIGIRSQLSEATKRVRQENSRDGSQVSQKSLDEVSALKSVKNLQVAVNTRQSVDSDLILRQYAIELEVPFVESEAEILLNRIKTLDSIATRVTAGKVSFGEMTMTQDRSKVFFRDSLIVEDKYAVNEDVIVEAEYYQYSFPLSLLTDNTAARNALASKAKQWANSNGEMLDKIMATQGTQAKRLKTEAGSANALYVYELSFKLGLDGIDRMAEQLNKVFQTSGVTTSIVSGHLQITIPLPPHLVMPIDVPTMYQDVFGEEESD